MVHESLETRQFGFIHPVWYRAKQPDKAKYQKRPKPRKKAPRSSRRGAAVALPFALSVQLSSPGFFSFATLTAVEGTALVVIHVVIGGFEQIHGDASQSMMEFHTSPDSYKLSSIADVSLRRRT
ncbi:MAG: hypothetical protein Q4C10_09880 [Clostridia bacterium]|nr:hypothetical protein [Clostridia bacterium]